MNSKGEGGRTVRLKEKADVLFRAVASAKGLRKSEKSVLEFILSKWLESEEWEEGVEVSVAEIARCTEYPEPTVCKAVRGLELRGFIARRRGGRGRKTRFWPGPKIQKALGIKVKVQAVVDLEAKMRRAREMLKEHSTKKMVEMWDVLPEGRKKDIVVELEEEGLEGDEAVKFLEDRTAEAYRSEKGIRISR